MCQGFSRHWDIVATFFLTPKDKLLTYLPGVFPLLYLELHSLDLLIFKKLT